MSTPRAWEAKAITVTERELDSIIAAMDEYSFYLYGAAEEVLDEDELAEAREAFEAACHSIEHAE